MHIIPKPAKTQLLDGKLKLESNSKIFYHPDSRRAAKKLNDFLSKHYNFTLETMEHDSKNLLIAPNPVALADKNISGSKEAYQLEINDIIEIQANTDAGIFYGVITLCQMLEDSLNLPCCIIEDAPAMSMRGIHWDLKGLMPTFEYLKEQIKRYAYFKVNTILAEYEDTFFYDKHPALNSPNALSKEQVKELLELAKENYIQVIPLVQSLGHAEYILRHAEYAHVAETPDGNISQMCPSNPQTFELFESFVDELLKLHDSEYIHIGGDETRQLGECAECAATVEKSSDIDLYFTYIKKCCEAIVARGRKPIIWDDMLCRRFRLDLLEQLPSETVICCWEYERQQAKHPYFLLEHNRVFSKAYQNLKKCNLPGAKILTDDYNVFPELYGKHYKIYEELPLEIRKKISEFVEIADSPRFFDSLPALNLAQKAKLKTICASGAHVSLHGQIMPNLSKASDNIRVLSERAAYAPNNIVGVIATSWSRSGSSTPVNTPQEARFYVYVLSAEHAWSGGRVSNKEFDSNFAKRVFGCEDDSLEEIIWLLKKRIAGADCLKDKFAIYSGKIKHSFLTFEALQIASEIEEMRLGINGERFGKRLGVDMLIAKSEKEYLSARQRVEDFKQKTINLQERCKEHLLKYMPKSEVQEYLDTVFLKTLLTIGAILRS